MSLADTSSAPTTAKRLLRRLTAPTPFQLLRRAARSWRRNRLREAALTEFRREFEEFRRLSEHSRRELALDWAERYPCLADRTSQTEDFARDYVLHTAWAARILAETRPERHVDISSYVYFAALVSAFVPMEYYEYRPADLPLSNLTSGRCDLLALPFADASVRSLSCMHVVEHIGLGRYGDPLDPEGDLKAMAELRRVLAVGGQLLFVIPVGRPRVVFNAHRIYSHRQVLAAFAGLRLRQAALIPDDRRGILVDCSPEEFDAQHYGCGCYLFTR